jgi:hypothetical protein
MLHSTGSESARSSAQQLLTAFSYDLPALLDRLYAMEITPSYEWTDHALRAWLSGTAGGSAGGSAGTQLSIGNVRTLIILLEAIYGANLSSSRAASPPMPYTAVVPQQLYNGTWRAPSPSPVASVEGDAIDESGGGGGSSGEAPTGASVRAWLDACLGALLDGGALAMTHQREYLYGMLPHLATAPSAAMVERLYGEAWPPYIQPGGATSVEQIASMLWLIAQSGKQSCPGNLTQLGLQAAS